MIYRYINMTREHESKEETTARTHDRRATLLAAATGVTAANGCSLRDALALAPVHPASTHPARGAMPRSNARGCMSHARTAPFPRPWPISPAPCPAAHAALLNPSSKSVVVLEVEPIT